MSTSADPPDGRPPIAHQRQVTIDALCDHFANDQMEVEEFERRVEAAHRAGTGEELKELLRDLPGGDLPASTDDPQTPAPARPKRPPVPDAHSKEKEVVLACLGGSTRKGRWRPARANYAVAIMGGAQLDFREAVVPAGVTEVRVFAMWGGVEIIVPPGMHVESHGLGLMGGFDHSGEEAERPADDAPVLRITGVAVMGGVEITSRYPGETGREARKRRRLERKQRRELPPG